jgi:GNAT superfamily N-acetyltransferase
MTDLEFTALVDEYVVVRLALADYRGSDRPFPQGYELADPTTYARTRRAQKRFLKQHFRHWKAPYRGRLNGWRDDSPVHVLHEGRLVGGVYLCDRNEFDDDPGWGQLHYAFMDASCQGQGIYSRMFNEVVKRARSWGLEGLYLNSDRNLLPEVYERWGGVRWKTIRKPKQAPPKRTGLRALLRPRGGAR